MNATDFFFGLLIKFGHAPTIIIIFLIGFMFIDRKVFGVTIFVTVFTMVFNNYLKSIWQVPLNPELGEGWAFPSGHTQVATVFWFFLSMRLKNRVMILITPLLLFGVVSGIVHFKYHEWYDILAAIGFAGLEIIGFHYILKLFDHYKIHYHYFGLILSLIVLMIVKFMLPMNKSYLFLYSAWGGMFGISLGWFLFNKFYDVYKIERKFTMLSVLGIIGIIMYLLITPIANEIKYANIVAIIFSYGIMASLMLPVLDQKINNTKRLSK